MTRLQISADSTHFIKDGKPFFLLSDTDWMVFQKLTLAEWSELVRLRKAQGFNALQISVLPIAHDNSKSEQDIEPFLQKNGLYDFEHINELYFEKAEKMLEIMMEYEMIPFLHLFWVNYIPDTWAAQKSPGTVIPYEQIKPLTDWMIRRFRRFHPIYSVSGDTNFETEQILRYYLTILDTLHEQDPEGLTTLHLQPMADPPEILCEHPQYHFYSYQSGHSVGIADGDCDQASMVRFSKQFLEKKQKKPIINTEPCYEGHGFGCTYGRFDAHAVRKAVWSSLLSGSQAGVTYGAHGVWQMYTVGTPFNGKQFSSMPYSFQTALHFPGAWDVGYSKWLYEKYELFQLKPAQELCDRSEQVRVAANDRMVVAYLPFNDDITFHCDLSSYRIEQIAMESKRVITPWVEYQENETIVHLSDCNEDILLLAVKE